MKLWQVSLIGLLLFGAADKAFAQQTSVDVKRLPIDLAKVTRDLKQSAATESRSGLNLRYRVDVYGQAPRIEIFTKQDNLAYGPAPHGAPTHQEMIDHVTPQEYRAPAADIGNLIRWLTERSKK
jgi:hypothetical protein